MKRFLFLFILTAVTYNAVICMQEGNQPKLKLDLINLGIIAGSESQYDNSAFIKKNLVGRNNEYQQEKAAFQRKIEGYRLEYGEITKAESTQKQINLATLLFSGSAVLTLGAKCVLPLVSSFIKRFWNLHPKSSLVVHSVGMGCAGIGILLALANYGHSQALKEYKQALDNIKALENLKKYMHKGRYFTMFDEVEEKED